MEFIENIFSIFLVSISPVRRLLVLLVGRIVFELWQTFLHPQNNLPNPDAAFSHLPNVFNFSNRPPIFHHIPQL